MKAERLIAVAGFTGEVRYAEPMSRHTSLGIGGPAEAMAFPGSVQELARLLKLAHESDMPVFILGRGTNLLVLDGGIPGLVVNTGKMDWMELTHGEQGTSLVHAGAGAALPKLVNYCADNGLSGMEFAAGIPGTVGGAVRMNAGTKEAEMKDALVSVTLVGKDGSVINAPPAELNMTYRHAGVPEGSAVAEATVGLVPWPKEEVRERVSANIRRRKTTQPMNTRSAGSTFKNSPGYSAWKLIDMCGLRGKGVGAAQVSMVHSNFLINTGGATAKEFKALMDLVVKTVQDKLNITLEPEIQIVGIEK